MKHGETGQLRTVYVPNGLDKKIEETRQRLGWSRSYIFKYALTKLLQELSVLSEVAHEEELANTNSEEKGNIK